MPGGNKSWNRFKDQLAPEEQEHLVGKGPETPATSKKAIRDESQRTYDQFMSQSEPVDIHTFTGLAGDDDTDKPPVEGHYHLLIIRNGEIPQVRRFKSPSFLAAHMQTMIDEDAYVIPFHGQIFPYTQGPERLLLVSSEVALTFHKGASPTIIELPPEERDELVAQQDYFIGPPEMVDIEYDEAPYLESSDALVDDLDDDDEFADDDF